MAGSGFRTGRSSVSGCPLDVHACSLLPVLAAPGVLHYHARMRRGTLPVAMAGLMLLVGLSLRAGDAGTTAPQPPMFPRVTLLPLDGGAPVPIASYRGHPVLVNFWATWCPPCRAELPELQHLYHEYGRRGLKVAAVDVNRSSKGVAESLQQNNLDLPVFRMEESVLRRLGVSSIPMSVLVDATGRVVRVYRGYDPAMVRDIERHLEGMIPAGTRGAGS